MPGPVPAPVSPGAAIDIPGHFKPVGCRFWVRPVRRDQSLTEHASIPGNQGVDTKKPKHGRGKVNVAAGAGIYKPFLEVRSGGHERIVEIEMAEAGMQPSAALAAGIGDQHARSTDLGLRGPGLHNPV